MVASIKTMLVSDGWAGFLLCLGLAVLRPCLAIQTAADAAAERRWLAYFVCLCVFVLPLFCLPAWLPLRYDAMAGGMLLLGWNDAQAALCVYEERVRPVAARLLQVGARDGARPDERFLDDGLSDAADSASDAADSASNAAAAGSDDTDVTLVTGAAGE